VRQNNLHASPQYFSWSNLLQQIASGEQFAAAKYPEFNE
jgi:hypothetical protein